MSIEQTKLFKESIETPILKTNEVKAQVVEASQVASDDIWVLGYNLENVLFGDDIIEQIADSTELLKSKHGVEPTYGAEQIIAFQMEVPQEYKGKYISSVTLRRRDSNTGSGQPIAQQEQVYLYANCMTSYKELGNNNNINENDFIVDTFYSIDKHRQTVDDGLKTTWNFDEPIKIKRNYNYIRFYCTRVRGEAQTNINLRSSNVKFNNKKGLLDGWITIDQAGPVGFTTEFTVNLLSKELGFITHIQNTSIHLDEQKNNLLNSISDVSNDLSTHANDENVHITPDQKEKLKTLHILQTSYNIHKNNKTIHVTQEDKERWNQKLDESDIEEYFHVPTLQFSTLKEGFVSHEKGMGEAYYIQLSRQHFTSGKINEIHIPYKTGKNKTSYLCAQIYNQGDDENVEKTFDECIFSINNQSQPQGSEGTSVFEFDNLILPQNYRFVRFIFTQNTSTSPIISSKTNVQRMRVRVITQSSNQQGWQDWDDDDCKILGSDDIIYNWYGYVQAVGIKHVYVVTNDEKEIIASVSSISTSVTSHISDDNVHHTTDEILEIVGTEEIRSHITDTNIHFSKDLVIDGIIEVDEQFEERTWDFSQGASASGAQGIAYAQICNNHILPQGSLIKQIAVPQHRNPSSSEYTANTPLYLVIFGDRNDNDVWEYVTHSSNTQQQIGGGDAMIFNFDSRINIGAYKKYRFFYVLDEANVRQLPSVGTNFNGVKMAFPSRRIDDACKVMQTNGAWANRHTFPAIITYDIDLSTSTSYEIIHKDNEDRHITLQQKNDMLESMVALSDTITTLNGHIGDISHLTNSQIESISKVGTIETTINDHIGNASHLNDDDKSKINKVVELQGTLSSHIGDATHLTDEQKLEIEKISTIETHINNIQNDVQEQLIQFSEQTEFEFISSATNYQDCQGIAYVQICGNHKLAQNSILKEIRVVSPQVNPSSGQFTSDNVHLVIYGDVGGDNYELIDCSTNTQHQIPYGDDMIFYFDGLKDLGQYEKYRLFYVRSVEDANRFPQFTNNSANYTDVKMAFRAYHVDLNCAIWQTNGGVVYNRSFPATFVTVNKFSEIINHKDNPQKHLTIKEKQFINDTMISLTDTIAQFEYHTNASDIHLTEDQVHELNRLDSLRNTVNNHVGDASHLSDSQKTEISKISTISTTIGEHKNDTDVHVTADDKDRWNSIETIDDETKNNIARIVSALLMPKTSNFTTVRDGFVTLNAGKATITCAQLTKKHFTTGRIKSIEFPYLGGTGTEGYLCVQFIGVEEDIDTVEKTFEDCYYSNEKMTQTGDGTAVFTFDNLVTPVDYKVVRFMIVADKTTVPNGRNGTNCLSWRARFMSPADNTGNYTTFDTDDCNVYNGSTFTNYVIYTKGVRTSTFVDEVTTDLILDMKNRIDELESRISSLQNS